LTLSKASFDPFRLPEPTGIDPEVPISPDREGVSKGAYDFSMIQEYSDLDYRQVDATVGARLRTSERASVTGSVTLLHLDDRQPYVYGDLNGSIWTYAIGAQVTF
jgi:hypothetical protein